MSEIIKKICGIMFEIITIENGVKSIVPTKDFCKAAPLVVPSSPFKYRCIYRFQNKCSLTETYGKCTLYSAKIRCPFCSSDRCLDNIIREVFFLTDFIPFHIKYIDIAKCKHSEKEFLIPKEYRMGSTEKDKKICFWCGSNFTEEICNLNDVRMRYFLPENIKKYKWVYDYSPTIEELTIDDENIFIYEDPRRCKHCKRVYGFSLDNKGWDLFKRLSEEITKKELEVYLNEFKINEGMLLKDNKCPCCFSQLRFTIRTVEKMEMTEIGSNKRFSIWRYKCYKCSQFFFSVADHISDYYVDDGCCDDL